MINIKNIQIEYIFSAIFGLLSLILSFLCGIIVGNGIAIVVLRSVGLSFLFAIVGFFSVYVLKRMIPEMYEFLSSIIFQRGQGDIKLSTTGDETDIADDMGSVFANEEDQNISKDELTNKGALGSEIDSILDSEGFGNITGEKVDLNNSAENGKFGKHLLADEKKLKFEPKIMAAAIRTMMKRDKEE